MQLSLKARLEKHQVWVYLLGAALGASLGLVSTGVTDLAETLIWPLLALLLFATFAQTPLRLIPEALQDRRFMTTALLANFVVAPVFVWLILQFMPANPPLRLGIALVLVVPCTDWFLTFTQLGRGDMRHAISLTPVNLLLQLVLLPVYIPLLVGGNLPALEPSVILPAVLVLLVPLVLAVICEFTVFKHSEGGAVRDALSWFPVPLLALVILCVTATNAPQLPLAANVAPYVGVASVVFALLGLELSVLLTRWVGLPATQGRTLAFTLVSRNSFVVLPLALALPTGWEVTGLAIITQSFVELFLLMAAVRAVPRIINGKSSRSGNSSN